jgi:site-specific DNA recombinase
MDTLTGWAQHASRRAMPPRQRRAPAEPEGIGFAFCWRCSTKDWQDPVTSRQWQWDNASELIAGKGRVVAEYGDVGYTRRLRWDRRPQAAALLKAVTDPGRGFEAIVIGETARAFYGNQFLQIAPVLREHGVQLWVPELGGPIDFDDARQMAVMHDLSMRAKQEVWFTTARVIGAMTAQARDEGRYLGGRPPYGYRLVDVGPHPTKTYAGWGRRQYAFEPDPDTAPHLKWIFAQRLTGRSVASIVRDLNAAGVPCPSQADPDRNPHRSADGWQLRTVASILANPRYTGRQVWNRQRTDHDPDDPKNQIRRGSKDVMRWNPPDQWVISHEPAHAGLVSEDDFIAVQKIRAIPRPGDGTTRDYALGGLIRCGLCGRKFDSHWSYNRAVYRCRHGHNSSRQPAPDRPKILYLREDHAMSQLGILATERGLPNAESLIDLLRADELLLVCELDGLCVQ